MKVVNSHFKLLVATKELRERRKLPVRVIVEESGASRSAVERLLNNTIKNVPLDDLAALCMWVPCEVGDLLRLEEAPEGSTNAARADSTR
jgi:putative transcriptional regulator